MTGRPTKLTEGFLDRMRWYWGTRSDASIYGMAKNLGVNRAQCYRWLARGRLDQARGKYTIYSKYSRELTKYQSVSKDNQAENIKREKRSKARGASKHPPIAKKTIFFTEATEDDFTNGVVRFPPRSEAPSGLTYSFWPPKTAKGFRKAKHAAWLSKQIPDKEWWEGKYQTDPETWVKPMEIDLNTRQITDYGDSHLHEEWRHLTPKPVDGDYSQFSGQGTEDRWLAESQGEDSNE